MYSAISIYRVLIGIGKIKWPYMEIWKSKLPPTVKVFTVMLLRDKQLTHEVMKKRRVQCEPHCIICNNCPIESAAHFVILCPFATHVWFLMSNTVGYSLMRPQGTI